MKKNQSIWKLQSPYFFAWVYFLCFAVLLLFKTLLFHFAVGNGLLISSLWRATYEWVLFWGGKMIPILLVASIVFITKRQVWTIVLSLFVDLWSVAQLFYYKANGLFMSVDVMLMADNMTGFWNSLLTYIGWDICLFPISTLIYLVIFVVIIKTIPSISNKRYFKTWGVLSSIAIMMIFVDNWCYARSIHNGQTVDAVTESYYKGAQSVDFTHFNWPFGQVYYYAKVENSLDYNVWAKLYIRNNSILSFFPANILYSYLSSAHNKNISLTEDEKKCIEKLIYKDTSVGRKPQSNLIYILVESLESWALDSVCGVCYMPYCSGLLRRDNVICYKNLVSQTLHANSADGQMIGLTGLLPITDGATCRLYGQNTYPNYAHFFTSSAIVNPSRDTWQQTVVTQSYEFDSLIEPKKGEQWQDVDVVHRMVDYIFSADTPFCLLGITVTSHSPFSYGSRKPIDGDIPQLLSAYLNCLTYTDSCIGTLIDTIAHSSFSDNTTIVITGDHSIFRSEIGFADLNYWAQSHNVNFHAGNTFIPLIIASPLVDEGCNVDKICYQMDIYPTILSLLGLNGYMWHGVGENLLCDSCQNNRRLSTEEAFSISDKIIRSDYFRHYYKQRHDNIY